MIKRFVQLIKIARKLVSSGALDTINQLDKGVIRVAEKINESWTINQWVKKAVIMYFQIQKMKIIEVGPFEFHDKIPLKNNYKQNNR